MHTLRLEILKKLRDEGPIRHTAGICWNYRKLSGGWYLDTMDALKALFLDMGCEDLVYPVPGGEEAYDYYCLPSRDMWDRNTEYGRARWKFLNDMIAFMEKQNGTSS